DPALLLFRADALRDRDIRDLAHPALTDRHGLSRLARLRGLRREPRCGPIPLQAIPVRLQRLLYWSGRRVYYPLSGRRLAFAARIWSHDQSAGDDRSGWLGHLLGPDRRHRPPHRPPRGAALGGSLSQPYAGYRPGVDCRASSPWAGAIAVAGDS